MSPIVLAAAAFGDDPGRWPLPAARNCPGPLAARGGRRRTGPVRARISRRCFVAPRRLAGHHLRSAPPSFCGNWAGTGARQGSTAGLGRPATTRRRASTHWPDWPLTLWVSSRLDTSAALLERARFVHERAVDPRPGWRSRLAWVGAELAMAAGDGQLACEEVAGPLRLSRAAAPALRRHRVKSDIVLAAALVLRR